MLKDNNILLSLGGWNVDLAIVAKSLLLHLMMVMVSVIRLIVRLGRLVLQWHLFSLCMMIRQSTQFSIVAIDWLMIDIGDG